MGKINTLWKGESIHGEIETGETFTKDFVKELKYWLKLSEPSDKDGILLYGGNKKMIFKDINVLS